MKAHVFPADDPRGVIRPRRRALRHSAAATAVAAATLAFAHASGAAMTRLTDHGAQDCVIGSPTLDQTGSLIAFESTCDFTGQNADLNREIFRVDLAGTVTQLTDTTGCANLNPSAAATADAVAFDSDCDTGANADRNVEIFVVRNGVVSQLTSSIACMSLAPSLNAAGNLAAFDSDCDFDSNFDRSVEVYRANLNGSIEQLTDDETLSGCSSFNAASDAAGNTVAFESDCDPVGSNAFQLNEIFVAEGSTISQLTQSDDEPCSKTEAAITPDGTGVVFSSDCDLTGLNGDASTEVFSVRSAAVVQLSDDSGASGCESFGARVASISGDDHVVFASDCNLAQQNGDASLEIFRANGQAVQQLTDGQACWSADPAIAPGGDRIAFVSNCPFGGLNPSSSNELFVMTTCACGAPVSRDAPTATDALFALKTAVGTSSCAICECDVSDDGNVTASDALLILKKAVGQAVELGCEQAP